MTSTARSGGKSALCLANLHLLGRAWTAYQEDNERMAGWAFQLFDNLSPATEYKATRGTPYRWVEYPLYTPVYGSTPVFAVRV